MIGRKRKFYWCFSNGHTLCDQLSWAFFELNANDFTLDGLQNDESLLHNCREAYVVNLSALVGGAS